MKPYRHDYIRGHLIEEYIVGWEHFIKIDGKFFRGSWMDAVRYIRNLNKRKGGKNGKVREGEAPAL